MRSFFWVFVFIIFASALQQEDDEALLDVLAHLMESEVAHAEEKELGRGLASSLFQNSEEEIAEEANVGDALQQEDNETLLDVLVDLMESKVANAEERDLGRGFASSLFQNSVEEEIEEEADVGSFHCECKGGRGVGNTCSNTWDSDGKWCYLKGGLNAKNCPGAIKSKISDRYWSRQVCKASCECKGGRGHGNVCSHWDSDGTWCYLKDGLTARTCPGAIISSSGGKYWSKENCRARDYTHEGCECKGGRGVGNTCSSTWDSDGKWCYLKGGLNAKNCPGAIKSKISDRYWSRKVCKASCECKGGRRHGNVCSHWDSDGTWCYLKDGLTARTCPGAIISSSGGKYWSKENCRHL